jgi:hypothetical protein
MRTFIQLKRCRSRICSEIERSRNGIATLTGNWPADVLLWAMKPISYARHRFPPAVILYAVWLYLRFTLRYRDVEYLLTERGQEPEVLNVAVLRANLR